MYVCIHRVQGLLLCISIELFLYIILLLLLLLLLFIIFILESKKKVEKKVGRLSEAREAPPQSISIESKNKKSLGGYRMPPISVPPIASRMASHISASGGLSHGLPDLYYI
jgi:hypothetical protein